MNNQLLQQIKKERRQFLETEKFYKDEMEVISEKLVKLYDEITKMKECEQQVKFLSEELDQKNRELEEVKRISNNTIQNQKHQL